MVMFKSLNGKHTYIKMCMRKKKKLKIHINVKSGEQDFYDCCTDLIIFGSHITYTYASNVYDHKRLTALL